MSDSTPATECKIPQPGPSAEHDRLADESLSLLLPFKGSAHGRLPGIKHQRPSP